MALDNSFRDLGAVLRHLKDDLSALRVTVSEDKPLTGDVVLVDQFSNAAEDALGWIEEAIAAADECQRAVTPRLDSERARLELAKCQEHFHQFCANFTAELMLYERVDALMSLGRERRGEWQAWTHGVKAALDGCQARSFDVSRTLFCCWQNLAERAAATVVTVQTTNAGRPAVAMN